jgi:hypothetical protein
VGGRGGHAAPAPQLPRRRPIRLNPVEIWFVSLRGPSRTDDRVSRFRFGVMSFSLTGEPLSGMLAPSTRGLARILHGRVVDHGRDVCLVGRF